MKSNASPTKPFPQARNHICIITVRTEDYVYLCAPPHTTYTHIHISIYVPGVGMSIRQALDDIIYMH